MDLTVLGSCSGTEPRPHRHHTSFTIQHGGQVYWFDAGETCSYTAHLLGVDLLRTRAVFISHTHMDHVGGLPNLLWTLRKLNGMDPGHRFAGQRVQVFIPDLSVWEGMLQMLAGTEGDFRIDFHLEAERYYDGLVFQEADFRVDALHNLHLGEPDDGRAWRSYSFLIRAAGKRVIFSGDVKSIRDLEPLLLEPCDLLLMETGHHKVEDICTYLVESRAPVRRLGFLHHGRAILADPQGELETARRILGQEVFIADDGTALTL